MFILRLFRIAALSVFLGEAGHEFTDQVFQNHCRTGYGDGVAGSKVFRIAALLQPDVLFAQKSRSQDLRGNVAAELILAVQIKAHPRLIGFRVKPDSADAPDQYACGFDGGIDLQTADVAEIGINGVSFCPNRRTPRRPPRGKRERQPPPRRSGRTVRPKIPICSFSLKFLEYPMFRVSSSDSLSICKHPRGQYKIDRQNRQGGRNHRARAGAQNAFRSRDAVEALMHGNQRYRHAERGDLIKPLITS
ncbi:Uncharacterised protein [Neisseria gonorrhoeae]|nr:Uncharacterised protein [Neisseria gonorrhoeae]